jgi:hypothetical protein
MEDTDKDSGSIATKLSSCMRHSPTIDPPFTPLLLSYPSFLSEKDENDDLKEEAFAMSLTLDFVDSFDHILHITSLAIEIRFETY